MVDSAARMASQLATPTPSWEASGGLRLIEAPKPRLKMAQRKLLQQLLERVPVHEAAHGFVRDRSVRTNAMAHSGNAMVIRVDLREFFASLPASRVHAIFCHLASRTSRPTCAASSNGARRPNTAKKSSAACLPRSSGAEQSQGRTQKPAFSSPLGGSSG